MIFTGRWGVFIMSEMEIACTKELKSNIIAENRDGDKIEIEKGETVNYYKISNGIDVYHRISKYIDGRTYVWCMHKYISPDGKEVDKVNW